MPRLWIGKVEGGGASEGARVRFTSFGDAKRGDLVLLYAKKEKAFTLLARVASGGGFASAWWPRVGHVVEQWNPGLHLAVARKDKVLGAWGLIRRNVIPPAALEPAASAEHLARLAAHLPGLEVHLRHDGQAREGRDGSARELGPLARADRLGRSVIRCLGESIEEAARRRPEAWGLTVLRNGVGVRLNVGRVEVFVLGSSGDHIIVCLRKALPSRAAIEGIGGSVATADHASLTAPAIVRFPERTFSRGYHLVREAHFEAISEAARYRHYSWKPSHSSAAVSRVSEVSGLNLPDPLYAKGSRNSFLLTSNPDTEQDGFTGFMPGATGKWRCWSKAPCPGDKLFWLRQGGSRASRGIFASGFVTKGRDSTGRIEFRVEKAVDLSSAALFPLAQLAEAAPRAPWRTQRSGVGIAHDDAEVITHMWRPFVEGDDVWDELDEPEALEGQGRRQEVIRRSRDLGLRARKIATVQKATGRLACEVPNCGFDFHAAYGELGRDFAVVHHEDPVGSRKRASKTKLSRLRVVCANCHAIIHRGGETRSLAAIALRGRRNAPGR